MWRTVGAFERRCLGCWQKSISVRLRGGGDSLGHTEGGEIARRRRRKVET